MKNRNLIKILTSLTVIITLIITTGLSIKAETIIDSTDTDIIKKVNESPCIPDEQNDVKTSINFNFETIEKKYAVIMVGRYFGMWNFGKPSWNYNQIQQYYTWYTNRAGRMYKLLNETYGWDSDNIFLLIRLLPESFFTYGEDFNPSMKNNEYSASKSDLNNLLNTFKSGGIRELDENDLLLVCLIDHGGVYDEGGISWISPDSHNCGNWKYICKSHDDNLQTESIYNSIRDGLSDPLKLTLNQPKFIKGFRIDANQNKNFDSERTFASCQWLSYRFDLL